MRLFLVLVLGMLLVYGCLGTPQGQTGSTQEPGQDTTPPEDTNDGTTPGEDTTPPANDSGQTEPPPSCQEYCMSQPHIQCVGEWNISGTYPDCVCGFVCEQQGGTEANESGTEEAPLPAYTPIPTDRSVSQMMDDELGNFKDRFYLTHEGNISENTYTWKRIVPFGDGFSTAPATDVMFDDRAIDSIEASGFVIFENNDYHTKDIYGVAICRAKSTILDDYSSNDMFNIDYFPATIHKHLLDCWIETRDYNIDIEGDWLITYKFRC